MNHSEVNYELYQIDALDTGLLTTLYILLMFVGLIANSTIFITVLGRRDLHKIPQMILLNLIVCDLLQTLLSAPYYIYSLSDAPIKSEHATNLCKGYLLFSYTLGYVSIESMLLISLDRYIAVVYPYFYHHHVTRNKIIVLTMLCWLLPLIACFPPTVIDGWLEYDGSPGGFCGVQWYYVNRFYVYIIVGILFALPTVAIFATNIRVYIIARRQLKIQKDRSSTHSSHTSNNSIASRKISTGSESERKISQNSRDRNSPGSSKALQKINEGFELERKISQNSHVTVVSEDGDITRPSPISIASRRLSVFSTHVIQRFGNSAAFQTSGRNRVTRKDVHIAVATLLLIGFYLLSWLPFVVPRILKASGLHVPRWLLTYTPVFAFSTVAWDPLLILWCRNEIRRSVARQLNISFIKRLWFKRNARDGGIGESTDDNNRGFENVTAQQSYLSTTAEQPPDPKGNSTRVVEESALK